MALVRRETPEDVRAIRRVNELAFEQIAEADLVDALRARGKVALSLVAVEDDRVVGHILFSPVTIESAAEVFPALGLGPMGVLPERQGHGIGSMLVRSGLDECRSSGQSCVVVVGHAHFYPRFGFVPASRFGLKCEYDVPDNVFMAIELRVGALSGQGGLVKYQSEFNEV